MLNLDEEIIEESGKLTTPVYHKPAFSRIYIYFDRFFQLQN